jgi:hypothetical protein
MSARKVDNKQVSIKMRSRDMMPENSHGAFTCLEWCRAEVAKSNGLWVLVQEGNLCWIRRR